MGFTTKNKGTTTKSYVIITKKRKEASRGVALPLFF
jgi:hypothetical protein